MQASFSSGGAIARLREKLAELRYWALVGFFSWAYDWTMTRLNAPQRRSAYRAITQPAAPWVMRDADLAIEWFLEESRWSDCDPEDERPVGDDAPERSRAEIADAYMRYCVEGRKPQRERMVKFLPDGECMVLEGNRYKAVAYELNELFQRDWEAPAAPVGSASLQSRLIRDDKTSLASETHDNRRSPSVLPPKRLPNS
ncbi:MAG: hypothetical protein IPK79_04625 [Vampirovibrionales bacterium]|nr:hypothetical protein [Vampirovibrionales bacterium]